MGCLFIIAWQEFFLYSEFQILIRYTICKYFLLFCELLLYFLHGVLWCKKVLFLVKCCCFSLWLLLPLVSWPKIYYLLRWLRFTLSFIQKVLFIVLALTFWFFIHVEFFWCVCGGGWFKESKVQYFACKYPKPEWSWNSPGLYSQVVNIIVPMVVPINHKP